jgi:hypothetical protein
MRQIGENLPFQSANHGSWRHGNDEILTVFAVTFRPTPVTTVVGAAMGMIFEREQRGSAKRRFEIDVATVSPVASVRTTLGDVGFSAKRNRTGAAITCLEVDLGLINERGHDVLRRCLGVC